MTKARVFTFLLGFMFFATSAAVAQVTVISAQDLKVRMHVDHRTVLVDTRMPEEYQAGHIPGAINIPAEQMKSEKKRLPKNTSVPIIFYCRGMS